MLLSRSQQVKTGLIHHGLLFVLKFEPVTNRLVQRDRFLLHAEAMRVDILNHAKRSEQILALGPDRLRVAWFKRLCEVLELRFEVDL